MHTDSSQASPRAEIFEPVGEVRSCHEHPESAAVAFCSDCGRLVCQSCFRVGEGGLSSCNGCERRENQSAAARSRGPAGDTVSLSSKQGEVQVAFEDKGRGFVEGFVESCKAALLSPTQFYQALESSTSWKRSIIFGYVCTFLGLLFPMIWLLLFDMQGEAEAKEFLQAALSERAAQDPLFAQQMQEMKNAGTEITLEMIQVVYLLLSPLITVFVVAAEIFIFHLAIRLVGGQGPLTRTIQIYGYSSAASLLNVVPFVGRFLSLVATVFGRIVGLGVLHKLSPIKTMVAVFIPVMVAALVAMMFGI